MEQLADKEFTLQAEEIGELVEDARDRTLRLVADLHDEQLRVPLREIVNPFLWELGHAAYFYDVLLLRLLGSTAPVMEGSDELYDSFRVHHDERWSLPLPSREKTLDYMEEVQGRALGRLRPGELSPPETYLYLLAVYHEDMHGEAFTYMRQTLEYPAPELHLPAAAPDAETIGGGPLHGDVEVPGGTFRLGAPRDLPFVCDNEKWAHWVEVAPFHIARTPVTNGEFAEFVEDGGYQRRELWSYRGWQWRMETGAQHPVFWRRGPGGWHNRHFDTLVPVTESAPVVHVTWYEAEAYCEWAERRLPTELEWEAAASGEPAADGEGLGERKRRYPWGEGPPTPERANLDSHHLGCVEVGAFPAGDSAFGCRQMIGNVWEWTASPFYPFPGYVVDFPYKEYSAPWFGYRKVLKGGAWATRSRLIRNSWRNFFQPYRNDIFAGFRTCARG